MSNNKKPNSVEWQHIELSKFLDGKSEYADAHDILNKAKAMHKEEVLSFDTLLDKHEMEALNNNTILLTKEEFYNETFGGNNEQQPAPI